MEIFLSLPLTPPKNEYKPLDSCGGKIKILDSCSTSQIHLWSQSKISNPSTLALTTNSQISNRLTFTEARSHLTARLLYFTLGWWGVTRSQPWFLRGKFDCLGILTLMFAVIFSSLFAPLVLFRNGQGGLLGMTLWGIGMGVQESILKATVARLVPADKRGSASGIFNTGYGWSWFLGSWAMIIFYDRSITWLVIFSIALQLAAFPVLLLVKKRSPVTENWLNTRQSYHFWFSIENDRLYHGLG